ncbi:MAG: type I methionyl aminopeptidase [bacterium]|nr:type I methionyl aminopeptidase [bacterium]
MFTRIKTIAELESMRTAGAMLATILELVQSQAQVGMSTKDMADIAAKELQVLGGKPSFLGYEGHSPFPDVICISLNDEVVHGIPSKNQILRPGDLVSIDFGVTYDGMVTDAARTFVIGDTKEQVKKLIRDTERAMYSGIDVLKNGVRVGDVSNAIQKVLVEGGYGIVRDLVGHGVGHQLHEEPDIPNYGFAGSGSVLKAGMTIAIEPMATLGTHAVTVDDDQWTIRTADGSLAAHFENTILITERGHEILTVK